MVGSHECSQGIPQDSYEGTRLWNSLGCQDNGRKQKKEVFTSTSTSTSTSCSPLNSVYDELCEVIVVPLMIWLFNITVAIIQEQYTYLSKIKYKTNNTQLTKLVMVLINPPDACSSIAACFLNKQIQTVQNLALTTTLYFIKA